MKNEAWHMGAVSVGARLALSAALLVTGWTQVHAASMYAEQSELVRGSKVIAKLGSDLFGDKVSLYTGGLEFVQTDISLPGNSALPVSVARRLTTGTRAQRVLGHFGRWDLEVPRIHGIFAADEGWIVHGTSSPIRRNRCSEFDAPPEAVGSSGSGGNWAASEFWRGTSLYVPGAGDQEILRRIHGDNVLQPTGQTYPLLTTGKWMLRCGVIIANPAGKAGPIKDRNDLGEGFEALGPDGTRYRFDWMVKRAVDTMQKPWNQAPTPTGAPTGEKSPGSISEPTVAVNSILPRTEYWLMPTLITDRFGNTVQLQFGDATDPWRITKIISSDERQLTFTYDGSSTVNTHRVSSISDGTRTWQYGYTGDDLTSVTLPDGSAWMFNNTANLTRLGTSMGSSCDDPGSATYIAGSATFTHPSGAVGTFSMDDALHARSMVPRSCLYRGSSGNPLEGEYAQYPRYFSTNAIRQKVISGPGLPAETWTYAYSDAMGKASWDTCTSGCVHTKTVDVTGPRGVTRHTFGIRWKLDEGQLLRTEEGFGTGTTRVTSYRYRAPANTGNPWPDPVGETIVDLGDTPMSARWFPQDMKVVAVQGVNFGWEASAFDEQSRPTTVTKTGTGGSRTEATSYHDNKTLWVLGQIGTVSSGGQVMVENEYHAGTAQLLATKKFGKLQQRMTYNGDGTLATKSDPALRTTVLRNYRFGLAQNADYPDGSSESAIVNDIGNIDSVTSAAGYTTAYGYDAMGRLSQIVPPPGWSPTTLDFKPVAWAEYGIPGGHWQQTITRGNAVTVNYFDALWRVLMTRTFDSADPGNTRKVIVRKFDIDGALAYESYPQRDAASVVANLPSGKRMFYDALGRLARTEADSELGVLTTQTEYLTGFQTRTTNPRSIPTVQGFWALDNPADAMLSTATLAAATPRQAVVQIERDTFGKPITINRSGNYAGQGSVSVTRSYVYDLHQRLCKTVEPEIKATVQDYDDAGNVLWRAPGVNLPGLSACDTASVAETAKIRYAYDSVNQLKKVTYSDGSPGITRTYTPDGLLETIETDGGKPSLWTYHYNSARLLDQETLSFQGKTYTFNRAHTPNELLSVLRYPDNSIVLYNPNALGEATQVGGYATGVRYHPNGAVAGFAFGNNIAHELTQNVRGLPRLNQDGNVLKDQYAYDANGNVTGIADIRSAPADGAFERSMGYDELDRLIAANAPGTWGSATYTYDPVDNLRSANVQSRSVTLNYDGTNRLASALIGGTSQIYLYDDRGNIRSKGAQSFSFDLGNRLRMGSGGQGYTYDGHGRRLEVVDGPGVTRLQVYSQGGQLLWADAPGLTGNIAPDVTYSCSAGNVQGDQCVVSSTYPSFPGYKCELGDSLEGSTCTKTSTSTYSAMPMYECRTGDSLTNSTCTTTTTTDYPATPSAYGCNAGDELRGTTCDHTTTSSYAGTPTGYFCNSGDSLSAGMCTHTTASEYAGTATGYSCNAGDEISGSTCTHVTSTPAIPVYSCPANLQPSGSNCIGTTNAAATVTYSCNGHGSLQPDGSCMTTLVSTGSVADDPLEFCEQAAQSIGLVVIDWDQLGPKRYRCYLGPIPIYSCPNGGTPSGTQCLAVPVNQPAIQTGFRCNDGTLSGSQCQFRSNYAGTALGYSCNVGDSLSNGICTHTTVNQYAGTATGYSCNSGDSPSAGICTHTVTSSYQAWATSYACNTGDSRSGGTCTHVSVGTYPASIQTYSCASGDSLSSGICTHTTVGTYAATPTSATCNAGDSLNNSICTHLAYSTAIPSYSCSNGGTVSNGQCVGGNNRKYTAYIYLGTKQVAEVETANGASTTQYVHTDALGSPVAHTNSAQQELNRTRFEPYGYAAAGRKPGVPTSGQLTTGSAIGFTGHVNDPGTDLVYMQQRYYDPIAGRFLSVDPVVTDANTGKGFGLYTYVDNNPYLKVDPDGKDAVVLYGGGISSNPFGHIAIAVSGKGVFSPGTGTAPGSSTTAYVGKQAEYRDTGVIVLKTTPAQDAAIVKSMEAASERPMPTTKDGAAAMLNDNCATRVGDALQSAGVISPATVAGMTQFTGVHFPKDVLKAALADNPSASSSTVSKGQKPPEDLKRFDPPKKADEK